jgi:hypothetical protein
MSLLNNQKFLQNAIMVMSVLILAGLAILVYGIVKKPGSSGSAGVTLAAPSVDAPEGTLSVQLPARSRVNHMTSYNGGVALHVSTVSGNFVYFVNSRTGKIDGALKLDTLPPAARGPLQR